MTCEFYSSRSGAEPRQTQVASIIYGFKTLLRVNFEHFDKIEHQRCLRNMQSIGLVQSMVLRLVRFFLHKPMLSVFYR
jgi:hypothetical protein